MTDNISAILYLISSIFFILALRGLSSPDSAVKGIFWDPRDDYRCWNYSSSADSISYEVILAGIVIGGGIGTFIARKIEMTALPQLVAGSTASLDWPPALWPQPRF